MKKRIVKKRVIKARSSVPTKLFNVWYYQSKLTNQAWFITRGVYDL